MEIVSVSPSPTLKCGRGLRRLRHNGHVYGIYCSWRLQASTDGGGWPVNSRTYFPTQTGLSLSLSPLFHSTLTLYNYTQQDQRVSVTSPPTLMHIPECSAKRVYTQFLWRRDYSMTSDLTPVPSRTPRHTGVCLSQQLYFASTQVILLYRQKLTCTGHIALLLSILPSHAQGSQIPRSIRN